MRKLRINTDKRAIKRVVSGAMMALFMALMVTGCSQAGGQDKTSRAAEQSDESGNSADGQSQTQAEGRDAGKEEGTGGQTLKDTGTGKEEAGGSGTSSKDADSSQTSAKDADSGFKPGMPVKEGVTAPDFTAELIDGTSITLSELQGKPVIINFWASWCGPCVKEMPAFERLKDDFGDEIGIIAVNSGEDADTVKDFAEKNGYTFPIAMDEDFAVSMLYPTNSIPYTVVVDAEGKVSHISTGALDADTMYERYKAALGV